MIDCDSGNKVAIVSANDHVHFYKFVRTAFEAWKINQFLWSGRLAIEYQALFTDPFNGSPKLWRIGNLCLKTENCVISTPHNKANLEGQALCIVLRPEVEGEQI